MVEGDGLENRCAVAPYRGFESHSLRQFLTGVARSNSQTGILDMDSIFEIFQECVISKL